MKVIGLDGKEYNLKLHGKKPLESQLNKSKGHLLARELLAELYPNYQRLEEVPLPGIGKKALSADFFLPQAKLIVEVQGKQHTEYVPHFHGSRMGYIQSLERDRQKKEWCELNSITLLELFDSETEDEWREKIGEC